MGDQDPSAVTTRVPKSIQILQEATLYRLRNFLLRQHSDKSPVGHLTKRGVFSPRAGQLQLRR